MIIEECNHSENKKLCDDCQIKNDAARFKWLLDNCNSSYDESDGGPQFICELGLVTPFNWRDLVRGRIDEVINT